MGAHLPHSAVLLQAALNCVERGWHVLPCHPGTKIPLIKHGVHAASNDPDQIGKWWTEFPHAMIAVACGPPSGVWAIDLDAKGNGPENFLDLAAGRLIPEAIKTRTPSGGCHLIFAWSPDASAIKNGVARLADGIDVRSAGGYVIMPPSQRFDGKYYETLADVWPDPPPAPQWLVDMVLAAQGKTERAEPPPRQRTNGGTENYAKAALDDECNRVASSAQPGRNHQLNTSAFSSASSSPVACSMRARCVASCSTRRSQTA